MRAAISDSSVLIHLAGIDRFHLLKTFFDRVRIPPAVWREVVEEGEGMPGAHEVREAVANGWMAITAPADRALVCSLERELHSGEAEAIALAAECRGEVVLLDETEARREADALGLRKTGTVGLLMRARRTGVVACLRDELDRLRDEGGFWIGDDVYHQALDAAGEGA